MIRALGKWAEAGVPHKGWRCDYIEDLGEPLVVCRMCETVHIRYVHYMTHPEWSGELGCGCVCAAAMEDDCQAAYRRETALKAAVKRRASWLRRQWQVSSKGNLYTKKNGIHVTVFSYGSGYKVVAGGVFGRRVYPTLVAAKHAAFDLVAGL